MPMVDLLKKQLQKIMPHLEKEHFLWIGFENPGKYRITASVKDNLGTVMFTKEYVDVEVLDQAGTLPQVELITPMEDQVIPVGSSLRLSSTAMEQDGVFEGVQYYIDGELQYAWSGILDLNNTLPADGSLLIVNDGVGNSVTFEFDNNEIISSGGEFQVIAGQLRNKDNLTVVGEFTGSVETSYFIQIDGYRSIRWSKDGGSTFVNEKVSMDSTLLLGNGLEVVFEEIDSSVSQIGDSWEIIGNPSNTIISIYDEPAAVLRTRNAIAEVFNQARQRGMLEFRTEDKGSNDKVYLYSTLSLPYEDEVSITGTALSTESGTILFNDNDFDDDNESDNIIRRQNSFGREFYPFGMTWEPNATGSYSIFAVARDSQTGSQVVSKSRLISVVEGTRLVPEVTLDPVTEFIDFTNEAISVSLSATAFDEDGKILEV